MLSVIKFGGTSLSNSEKQHSAALIIQELVRNNRSVVCIVSAQGKTTDSMIAEMDKISCNVSPREYDAYLSTGEAMSAALLCMHLETLSVPCISLCGVQTGIYTTDTHKNAEITHIDTARIESELSKSHVVVVAGFQGVTSNLDITTFGRGGSDTTAISLACALHADECIIYTDVDGVFSADPHRIKNAKLYSAISYDEMLEMSSQGAKVMHDVSVATAIQHNAPFFVRSASASKLGTKVYSFSHVNRVTSIVCGESKYLYCVHDNNDLSELFESLSTTAYTLVGIDIDTVYLTSKTQNAQEVEHALIGKRYEKHDQYAQISVIGMGLIKLNVPQTMTCCLEENGIIPIIMHAGATRVTAYINEKLMHVAERTLHELYFE